MPFIDDGQWNAGNEPKPEDEQVQWHAGPATYDKGDWVFQLIENPDLGEDWKTYQDHAPGAICLN